MNAIWVSRKLREAGVNISPWGNRHKREGVYVKQAGYDVTIYINIDDMRLRCEHASVVLTALANLGIDFEIRDDARGAYIRSER